MISIGGRYEGPELRGCPIYKVICRAMKAVVVARGYQDNPEVEDGAVHDVPTVNVVFYVPGSLGDFDIPKIAAGRYSRKRRLLLVEVPVPRELVYEGDGVAFVINALHTAVKIAAEVFAKKGPEPFDLAKAQAMVEEVRRVLESQSG